MGNRYQIMYQSSLQSLVAILWALGWVEKVRPGKIIICSDSTAALMALKGGTSGARPDLIVDTF